MNIIKQGSEEKLNKVKRFECGKCGCIFEVDKHEYEENSWRNETSYLCNCPFCNQPVYVYE